MHHGAVADVRERLLRACPDDYVRVETEDHDIADVVLRDGAVGWTTRHWSHDTDWTTVLGADCEEVAEVARTLVALSTERDRPSGGLTVSRAAAAHVSRALPWEPSGQWEWWLTRHAPAYQQHEGRVVELSSQDPRLAELIAIWSPQASVSAGDAVVRSWVGIVADDRLLGCGADTRRHLQVPHLAGVVTEGGHRGRGYAGAICAKLTRDALAEGAPLVTLSMYSDNDAARRTYTRLGFRAQHAFSSGRLPG
jgi:RimJ/RimL family protein N-acetyltransferase